MFDITQYFKSIPVLDKGFIELIDGMVVDPKLKIVNSARVSFNKQVDSLSEKDMKLVTYLHDHEHFSVFRHSYFSFRWKAPLSVFRQFWKYQIGCDWVETEAPTGEIRLPETNWNENSLRYSEASPEFYIPETIRIQSKDNKQGSHGKLEALQEGEDPVEFFKKSCERQYQDYQYMVASGAAKEQCRFLLPQNIYTQCIWTASLQCIMFVCHQRLKPDAQHENREYAIAIKQLMDPILHPLDLLVP